MPCTQGYQSTVHHDPDYTPATPDPINTNYCTAPLDADTNLRGSREAPAAGSPDQLIAEAETQPSVAGITTYTAPDGSTQRVESGPHGLGPESLSYLLLAPMAQ